MKLRLRLTFILTFFMATLCSNVQSQQFSILTCKGGSSVVNVFGHIAIRYNDPFKGIDNIYDYGVFEFSNYNYILKFCLERLDYAITKEPTAYFIDHYLNKNIQVREQVLNLSDKQIKKLLVHLERQTQPGFNHYKYDFLYQNCSTKILELIEKGCGDIDFTFYHENKAQTYRELIHAKSKDLVPWGALVMDLLIGNITDKKITDREYCFLPKYLCKTLRLCYNEELKCPLVKNEHIVIRQDFDVYNRSFFSKPEFFAAILLIIGLFHNHFKKRATQIILGCFFILIGIMGCIATFEMIFSSLPVTKNNWHLGWMNPLSLVYGIYLLKNKTSKIVRYTILAGIFISFLGLFFQIQGFQITTLMFMATGLLASINTTVLDALLAPLKIKKICIEKEVAQ